jgi:hypothetical protein
LLELRGLCNVKLDDNMTNKDEKVRVWKAAPKLRRLFAGLPRWKPGFAPGSIHVGFVVDKVAWTQVFLRVFQPSNFNILRWLSICICDVEDDNKPVGGRSSETQSHPLRHEQLMLISSFTDKRNGKMIRSTLNSTESLVHTVCQAFPAGIFKLFDTKQWITWHSEATRCVHLYISRE